jgi:uncharacterized protein (DUF849 family)
MPKIVVTAALTGGDVQPRVAQYLPITAERVADDAANCVRAGAVFVQKQLEYQRS